MKEEEAISLGHALRTERIFAMCPAGAKACATNQGIQLLPLQGAFIIVTYTRELPRAEGLLTLQAIYSVSSVERSLFPPIVHTPHLFQELPYLRGAVAIRLVRIMKIRWINYL